MFVFRDRKSKEEYDGIDMANLVKLEKLKQNQREDYLHVRLFFINISYLLPELLH